MNIDSNCKVVKRIVTKRYEIALIELPNGYYRIVCTPDNMSEDETVTSEALADYLTASYLFDMKLRDLEGQ